MPSLMDNLRLADTIRVYLSYGKKRYKLAVELKEIMRDYPPDWLSDKTDNV